LRILSRAGADIGFLALFEGIGMPNPERQLVLNKGLQKFVFRYEEGQEDEILEQLNACANDDRTDFDTFDAAVLSLKVVEVKAESHPEPIESLPSQANRRQ
jgi:hypothetical protein